MKNALQPDFSREPRHAPLWQENAVYLAQITFL